MKTIIRYAGGKSKAYKLITQHIPFNTKKIISPFIGGGSLEVRWATEQNIKVIGNDIFYHLVNFWNVLLTQPEALYEELKKYKANKEFYKNKKEELLSWNKTQDLLKELDTNYYVREPKQFNEVQGAALYFYNHQLSYGPMFLGWYSSIYDNPKKYEAILKRVRNFHINNDNLKVNQASFEEIIPGYSNDFMYLDPPYYLGDDDDNKMFKGMYPNCNFDIHHTNFDHEKLRDLLHNHHGDFILSYNNCETIREWYKDFNLYYPEWNYSYGAGETRVGKNKKEDVDNKKKSHEILIVKN